MSDLHKTELFWQAFRYVGDEMSQSETAEFEAMLEHDQPAREAIARIVELSQLVVAAESQLSWRLGEVARATVVPASLATPWRQAVGWAALGAAACLATVMVFQSHAVPSSSTQLAVHSPASADDLARAWIIARNDLPVEAETGEQASGDASSQAGADELALGTTDLTELDTAPSWLLAAVEDAQLAASREH